MKDGYNRTIDYIRISVTDRCNLRCAYCMTARAPRSFADVLGLDEMLRLCGVFARLGIERFKITGGEPLIREGVPEFIGKLKNIPGVKNVTMTTNGTLLKKYLPAIIDAGIDGVNISLDTLNSEVFKALTGSDEHSNVMSAIELCARDLPVKINCVPIAGINDGEIVGIAELAKESVRAVKFIELMPVGSAVGYDYISSDRVRELLEAAYGTLFPCKEPMGGGPASYYAPQGFRGRIGIINAMSHGFCQACNRIRLTSDGRLRLCLSHDAGVSLRGHQSDDKLAEIILAAAKAKPERHCFGETAVTSAMNGIGG